MTVSSFEPLWPKTYVGLNVQFCIRFAALKKYRSRQIIVNKKAELPQRWPHDAAMRPIHGCPENFRESLSRPTPTATFAEIFNGLLFRSVLWISLQNLKFALPIPEIIRGTKNLGSPWIRPRSLFSQICNGLLFSWTLWMYLPDLKYLVAEVLSSIIVAVFADFSATI